MNVTLRQLQAFIAVADSGNFTRAAERLRVAQSAVSVSVRELEIELAIRLLDRTTRRVELTDAGREFRGHAEKVIADLDGAIRDARDLVERKRGRITLCAPPLLAATLLPAAIAAFHHDYPGVQITLRDLPTDQIVAAVKTGTADIGVGTFAAAEPGLTRTPLFRDTLMVFCSTRDPLRRLKSPRWKDLEGLPFIVLTRQSAVRGLVDYACEAAGLAITPTFEVTQIATALALVESGLGVSALPSYALRSLKTRQVIARPLREPSVTRDVLIINRPGRSPPVALPEFLAKLSAACGKTR
jgi:DNA-binding transcriptional LysR family regulator